ncbi:MAG: FxsA family protein [Pseudomonadota bacterium]
MRWLVYLFPWIELFSLLWLGNQMGALNALLYVVATVFLGISILRWQGMEIISSLQSAQRDAFAMQRLFLGNQISTALAGVLIMIPGLLTDFLGATVLVVSLLRRLINYGAVDGASPYGDAPIERESPRTTHGAGHRYSDNNQKFTESSNKAGSVIDGEYSRLDDDDR